MTTNIRILGTAALALCLAKPAVAETIGYADAVQMLTAACGKDIDAHCGKVRLGSGRIEACLQEHASQVSAQCTATSAQVVALLDARAAAQAAAPKLCEGDIKRLCRNMRNAGWTLRCLVRSDNVRKVSNKCNRAITEAGWR
jgi:hypothetical protein